MILRHYQKCGHKPIVLIGGGTSKVGDPTGKDESRKMMTDEIIEENKRGIKGVFSKFLTFADDASSSSPSSAVLIDNNDWLSNLNYLQFLRDYGPYFTINRMLSFESVKQRMARDAPLSFLEFNYMILQAFDFLELSRRHGVTLQLGGSDQWGNMVSGVELGRRIDRKQLFALTAPLITTSDGKKMGKSEGGAVWLNKELLSEYDYWQFWRNTADDDVIKFLKLFTELPLGDIEELASLSGSDINEAKIKLADEATTLLHGSECLEGIKETAKKMFEKAKGAGSSAGGDTSGLNRIELDASLLLDEGTKVVDLFVRLELATSKKEAKRLITWGGAKFNDVKIDNENFALTSENCGEEVVEVVLRAGKKRAGVVVIKR